MTKSLDEHIKQMLQSAQDEQYRAFQAKLIPNVDPECIVGVRTPALRALAKDIRQREDIGTFLAALPHDMFEENQLHAFIISATKDYDAAVELLDTFLPFVDNWATCDQMSVKVLGKQPSRTLVKTRRWIASNETYTVRFGIGVLMRYFLDDGFTSDLLDLVIGISSGEYYVNMMRAWYFAEALVKQPEAALGPIEAGKLDIWTHNKSIQKATESRRVPTALKEHLKTLKLRP